MVVRAFRIDRLRRRPSLPILPGCLLGSSGTTVEKATVTLTHAAMTATLSTPSLAPFLAGYIAGAVSDDAMARFDDLFEDANATPGQREAFAQFYLDALATGEYADALPTPAEATGILASIPA